MYYFQTLEKKCYMFNIDSKKIHTGIEIYKAILNDYKHYGSIRNIKIIHYGKVLKYSDTIKSFDIFHSAMPFIVIYQKTDWKHRRSYLLHRCCFRNNIGLKPY